MFIKMVQAKKDHYYCSLVESYRENGKVKHRTIRSFGLLDKDQIPYLKAMYATKKPKLVHDD